MIEKHNKPLEIAVRSVMSLQSKRIFLEGKNASGAIIGEYSPKPIYVSPVPGLKTFPLKGKPSGRTRKKITGSFIGETGAFVVRDIEVAINDGKSKFKNGNPHKSGYFKNYLAFKEKVGRNKLVKTVDLFLTGKLHRNWANSESLSKPKATKVNQHNYFVGLSEENYNKVKPYGNVFSLSSNERKAFLDIIKSELGRGLKSA